MKYVIYKRNQIYDVIEKEHEIMYTQGNPKVKYVQDWEPPVEPRQVLLRSKGSNIFDTSAITYGSIEEAQDKFSEYKVMGFINPKTGELEHE